MLEQPYRVPVVGLQNAADCLSAFGLYYLNRTEGLEPSCGLAWYRLQTGRIVVCKGFSIARDGLRKRYYSDTERCTYKMSRSLRNVLLLPLYSGYIKSGAESLVYRFYVLKKPKCSHTVTPNGTQDHLRRSQ